MDNNEQTRESLKRIVEAQADSKLVDVKFMVAPTLTAESLSNEAVMSFISESARLEEIRIKEEVKNKRLGLLLTFLLIVTASGVLLFAPEGRETISYWVGASLLIFSTGAAGFGSVWGKTSQLSFGASKDTAASDHHG